ncbi:MAG: hypothetical protein K8S55_08245 [Phycisphaerae bacterium]|nr:hypothetical protein [Phycisphaerae bacterium]
MVAEGNFEYIVNRNKSGWVVTIVNNEDALPVEKDKLFYTNEKRKI